MMEVKILERVLDANDAWAQVSCLFIRERGIRMFNLIGSPGAGKTALLEKTIDFLKDKVRIGVIEGDLATSKDALRIMKRGVGAYQINTGNACHLDAHLVNIALKELCRERQFDLIFVENVGNLVCPAEFDIGEDGKVAVLSVTEGDDKIEKYPLLFSQAKVMAITKSALLAHTNFRLNEAMHAFRLLNPKAKVILLDSISGEGFSSWLNYISEELKAPRIKKDI